MKSRIDHIRCRINWKKNPNLVTSSVLTKNNCVFLASTSRAWVEPETCEAWKDLATQQCLQGVEVIKCYLLLMLYRRKICDSQAPKKQQQKKVEREE